MPRRGVTIVEVLTILGVTSLLVALLVPAVLAAREASRRTQCQSHLRQLGVAILAYESDQRVLPMGNHDGYSVFVSLLPWLDQGALAKTPTPSRFAFPNFGVDNNASRWNFLATHRFPWLYCPSDPLATIPGGYSDQYHDPFYRLSYTASVGTGHTKYGPNGVFPLRDQPLRLAEITDGQSNTAALSEFLVSDNDSDRPSFTRSVWDTGVPLLAPHELELFARRCREVATDGVNGLGGSWIGRGDGWPVGALGGSLYNHVLLPNDACCTNAGRYVEGAFSAASLHPGIVFVLFADGHVRGVSASVALPVWRAMGSRDGGETLSW